MNMQIEDRKILVEKIKNAFINSSMPAYVGYELEKLEGKKWDEVSVEDLRWHADELNSFTPEGFCYFLPAILIAVILDSKEADVLVDNIIYQLAPPKQGQRTKQHFDMLQNKFKKCLEILDLNQKTVIKQFVLAYRDLEPYGGWSFMDTDKEALEAAIQVWT